MMISPAICFLIWPWQIRHQIHWIPSIPSNYPCPLEKSCLMSIHVKKQAGTVNVTLWLCQNSYWTCTIHSWFTYSQWWCSIVFCRFTRPGMSCPTSCHIPPQKMPYPYPESRMLIHPTLSFFDPTLFWYDNCVISYVVSIILHYILLYDILISYYNSVLSCPYDIPIMSIICLLSS